MLDLGACNNEEIAIFTLTGKELSFVFPSSTIKLKQKMLIELVDRPNNSENMRLINAYIQFRELLNELNKKELTPEVIQAINQDIQELNEATLSSNDLRRLAAKKQAKIIRQVEKEMKIVPINYYRNVGLVLGLAAIGIPIGIVLGSASGNWGLLGIGSPIGMVIGLLFGTRLDKKALKEGRQLKVEIK